MNLAKNLETIVMVKNLIAKWFPIQINFRTKDSSFQNEFNSKMASYSIWIANKNLSPPVNSVGRCQTAELQQNDPDEAVWIIVGITLSMVTFLGSIMLFYNAVPRTMRRRQNDWSLDWSLQVHFCESNWQSDITDHTVAWCRAGWKMLTYFTKQ